jgi:hypothetical protein
MAASDSAAAAKRASEAVKPRQAKAPAAKKTAADAAASAEPRELEAAAPAAVSEPATAAKAEPVPAKPDTPVAPTRSMVTARASVPKARVDEVRGAMATPRHADASHWMKPTPKLRDRIRQDPAPYAIAAVASAVASAIAIARFLKGRKSD